MADISPDVLRAVTERVIDEFTSAAMMFTALDVSNVVKLTLADARHRDISPIVRAMFDRDGMGAYQQTMIDVLAGGAKPAKAYLYHLPEHPPSMYDDSMRNQLAIPPVSPSKTDDDTSVTAQSTEAKVRVGKDGRGRVSRRLLANAGITGDKVIVRSDATGPRLVIVDGDQPAAAAGAGAPGAFVMPFAGGTADPGGQSLTFEHPSLLHVPRSMLEIFGAQPALVARIDGASVVVTNG